MQLSEDSFRALARSSPRRWRRLHFTRRGGDVETVEAWLTRPGQLVVVDAAGRRHQVNEPQQPPVAPVRRIDGLVAHRPEIADVAGNDPMWQDYRWVAMLDPLELSHHTVIADLRDAEHRGRPAWRAVIAAREGYEPRCGCCPLLWSAISARDEAIAGGSTWQETAEVVFPIGWEVALDLQTGIVVDLTPIGGSRPQHSLDVEIHTAS